MLCYLALTMNWCHMDLSFQQLQLQEDSLMVMALLAFNQSKEPSSKLEHTALTRSSKNDWCMIESLSWTGSDIVRPGKDDSS